MTRKTKAEAGKPNPKPKATRKPKTAARKPRTQAKAKKAAPAVFVAERPPHEPVKRSPWRPTKYREEFCQDVIEYGRQGKSRTWIAATIGVVHETLLEWADRYPDFSAALTHAKQLEQLWWEDKGQNGLETTGFCQTMWGRNMAARFPKDWTEKQKVEHDATAGFASMLKELNGATASLIG